MKGRAAALFFAEPDFTRPQGEIQGHFPHWITLATFGDRWPIARWIGCWSGSADCRLLLAEVCIGLSGKHCPNFQTKRWLSRVMSRHGAGFRFPAYIGSKLSKGQLDCTRLRCGFKMFQAFTFRVCMSLPRFRVKTGSAYQIPVTSIATLLVPLWQCWLLTIPPAHIHPRISQCI